MDRHFHLLRRRSLLGATLFSWCLSCSGQIQMFQEGRTWNYGFMYNQELVWLKQGEPFASEEWTVSDKEIIEGKSYHKLLRNDYFRNVKRMLDTMWRPSFNQESKTSGHVISVREEAGKVYAIKDQYISFLKALYPQELHPEINEDMFYLADADNDNEILLYDFTLEEGDDYPCVGNQKVKQTFHYTSSDGLRRKVLVLTGGSILVEGIGCVNSIGSLVIYQNMSSTTEVLDAASDVIVYAHLIDCLDNTTDSALYLWEKDYPLICTTSVSAPSLNSKHSTLNCYDLSGRRLTVPSASSVGSVLPKGVYIEDGKKKVRN